MMLQAAHCTIGDLQIPRHSEHSKLLKIFYSIFEFVIAYFLFMIIGLDSGIIYSRVYTCRLYIAIS